MHYIYLITNKTNGKVYVGQTSLTPEQRLKEHLYSKMKPDYFHAAIRKHGSEAFVVMELQRCATPEEADEAEILWIAHYNSSAKEIGYNTTLGGNCGAVPNEEVRAKIGAASALRIHTSETRRKMREAHQGEKNHFFGKQHRSESVEIMKEKLRVALGGENNPWFGKTLSEEHRANISKAKIGKKLPPRSEETRRRASEAAKIRWSRAKEAQLTAGVTA